MKSNFVLVGILSLALVACDKKERVAETAKPEVSKKKAFGTDSRTTGFKPVLSKLKQVVESGTAHRPASESHEFARTSPDASAPPPAKPSASVLATEQLRQERLARMAKAHEERVAQNKVKLTTRYVAQDANVDGFLAKQEVDGRMQRRFAEADKNGDGFLNATEQAGLIQTAAERMSADHGERRGGQQAGRNRKP